VGILGLLWRNAGPARRPGDEPDDDDEADEADEPNEPGVRVGTSRDQTPGATPGPP